MQTRCNFSSLLLNRQINVVQKNIHLNGVADGPHANNFLTSLEYWINNNIKTNGFDGLLDINLISIFSSEMLIENGINWTNNGVMLMPSAAM